MFCTKCGYNMGDNSICPNCGNQVGNASAANPKPSQNNFSTQQANMTQQSVQPNEQQSFQPNVQQGFQSNAQQGFQSNGQQPFGNPAGNGQMPVGDMPKKKKKKWPVVTAVVVAVALVLGVGTYFAYPMIRDAFSPKSKAVKALKNTGSDLENALTGYVDKIGDNNSSGITQGEGWIKIDKFASGSNNLSQYTDVNTLKYKVQCDLSNNKTSGTIGLSKDNGDSIVDMKYLIDGDIAYYSIPALFKESFKTDLSQTTSGSSYKSSDASKYFKQFNSISGSFDNIDMEAVKQYSDVIDAVTKDVIKGYEELVDNVEYKKEGEETLSTNNGDIQTTKYTITVNEEALGKAIDKTIDELYGDSKLSSYIGLATTYLGTTQDDIKEKAKDSIKGMQPFTMSIYIKDDKVVKYEFDLSQYAEDNLNMSVTFTGKDSIYNGLQADIHDDNNNVTMSYLNENNAIKFNTDINLDKGKRNETKVTINMDMTSDGDKKVTINDISMNASSGNTSAEIALSGEVKASSASSLDIDKSDFKNPVDVTTITRSKLLDFASELSGKEDILKKLYKNYSSLGGYYYNENSNGIGDGSTGDNSGDSGDSGDSGYSDDDFGGSDDSDSYDGTGDSTYEDNTDSNDYNSNSWDF